MECINNVDACNVSSTASALNGKSCSKDPVSYPKDVTTYHFYWKSYRFDRRKIKSRSPVSHVKGTTGCAGQVRMKKVDDGEKLGSNFR